MFGSAARSTRSLALKSVAHPSGIFVSPLNESRETQASQCTSSSSSPSQLQCFSGDHHNSCFTYLPLSPHPPPTHKPQFPSPQRADARFQPTKPFYRRRYSTSSLSLRAGPSPKEQASTIPRSWESNASDVPSQSQSTSNSRVWDNVLRDVDYRDASMLPARRPQVNSATASRGHVRRQAMTREESNVFTNIFDQIFDSNNHQNSLKGGQDPLSGAGIGRRFGGAQSVDTFFGKLRRTSLRYKPTKEVDLHIAKLRTEMDMINNDQELLQWAIDNIFSDGDFFPEFASKMRRTGSPPSRELSNTSPSGETEGVPSEGPQKDPAEAERQFILRTRTYPHLVSTLISTFRDKFHDPHLALSIFEYARHLSVPSYVFGCTTVTYNELISTRWICFRDLRGIVDALQEMKINGVPPDSHTRRLIRAIRREVGGSSMTNLTAEQGTNTDHLSSASQSRDISDDGQVWALLAQMEKLTSLKPWSTTEEDESSSEPLTGSLFTRELRSSGGGTARPRPKLYQFVSGQSDSLELV